MARSKKICSNCGELKFPATKLLCHSCRHNERKYIDPEYVKNYQKVGRDNYRIKNEIPLDTPIRKNISKMQNNKAAQIYFCKNYLMNNGYEVKKIE